MSLLSIDDFGRYKIIRLIKRGGMATVYEAIDKYEGTRVALKIMNERFIDDDHLTKKFLREGHVLESFQRTYANAPIVKVLDFGIFDDRPFLALEFLEGIDLEDLIAKQGKQSVRYASEIVYSVAQALRIAHEAGILHRDISLSNIILLNSYPPGTPMLKVIDFGVAKVEYQNLNETVPGALFGKPLFIAPEQWNNGSVDGRSDIYSLGIVYYMLLTGKPPIATSNPLEVMDFHLNRELMVPAFLEEEAPWAAALLRKMSAKIASERVQRVTDILNAFDAQSDFTKNDIIAEYALPSWRKLAEALRSIPDRLSLPWLAAAIGIVLLMTIAIARLFSSQTPDGSIALPPPMSTEKVMISSVIHPPPRDSVQRPLPKYSETIGVEPAELSFASVTVGTSPLVAVTISNYDDHHSAFVHANMRGNTADFHLFDQERDLSIPPGSNKSIQVIFSPKTSGEKSVTISLQNKGAGNRTLAKIICTGSGI